MERTADGRLLVATDANILINFLRIGRLDILERLSRYAFRIPEDVYEEIADPLQREELDRALKAGWLEVVRVDTIGELAAYNRYRQRMGDGEAACLAVAVHRTWIMACDERHKKPLHQEIRENLGLHYLINTPGVLLQAIRDEVLTVEEADRVKDALAEQRFIMSIRTFRDLLNADDTNM